MYVVDRLPADHAHGVNVTELYTDTSCEAFIVTYDGPFNATRGAILSFVTVSTLLVVPLTPKKLVNDNVTVYTPADNIDEGMVSC